MALRETNLLPGDILDRRYLMRHISFWTGCMVISLSLVFGFYVYHAHVVLAKERPITTLEDMHTHLGTRVEEIKQVQEELERLDQQQTVLETITRHQSYSRVLLMLAAVMPQETWLGKIIVDSGKDEDEDKKNGTTLALSGFSYSNEDLGNFINRISSEAMFREVVLKYAKETIMDLSDQGADEPVKLVEFQIECNI